MIVTLCIKDIENLLLKDPPFFPFYELLKGSSGGHPLFILNNLNVGHYSLHAKDGWSVPALTKLKCNPGNHW